MKVKYQTSDGKIIAMGTHVGVLESGQTVVDVDSQVISQLHHFKIVNGEIVERSQAEKDVIDRKEKRFTPDSFLQKYAELPPDKKQTFLLKAVSKLIRDVKERELD